MSLSNVAKAAWLRCDLRIDDNLLLRAASEGATSLVPIYVFDLRRFNVVTRYAGARKCSARRARFLIESLQCLRQRLEALGSGVAVAIGRPEEVIPDLCAACKSVYVTEGVCSEEQAEEAKVAKSLKRTGAELQKVWGNTLYMPQDCGFKGSAPLLFTAFKNLVEGRGKIEDPIDSPSKVPPLPQGIESLDKALKFLPTLLELGYTSQEAAEAEVDDPRGVLIFRGGELAALERLQGWMFRDDRLKDYFDIRNGMKGEAYSSKLSPWLALGCISPRRIWKEAQRYERQRVKNKSTYWLIFELTWRDFFFYMAKSQGSRLFLQGGITGDNSPWNGSMAALQKWKEGRTGDPLVDVNMRELSATGFMSNRGRQNVASYLIFDLEVDWRYGAAHFEELLLDYDPCANWGNWVAAAGLTGQRVNKFNTKKQLNDYDPHREYVNHWLQGGPPAKRIASSPPAETSEISPSDSGKSKEGGQASLRRWVKTGSSAGTQRDGGYKTSRGSDAQW